MEEMFGEPALELLRSAKWQERVEAMGEVLTKVQAMEDLDPLCNTLMQCVAHLPGWGDKNFQVGGVCMFARVDTRRGAPAAGGPLLPRCPALLNTHARALCLPRAPSPRAGGEQGV